MKQTRTFGLQAAAEITSHTIWLIANRRAYELLRIELKFFLVRKRQKKACCHNLTHL